MPPSPERPFLLAAKNSGSRYCCACLYFCLLMLLSVFIVACVSVVCIIWWPGKLFRLSLSLFLLVLLLSVFIVVFCHCFLLSSLSVLYHGQASYSGCLVMPDRAVEAAQSRPLSEIRILLSEDRRRKNRNDSMTNLPTFPSDAVMFLRCRLHPGASSSNSLCPQQQLHFQDSSDYNSDFFDGSFSSLLPRRSLRISRLHFGLCWCCARAFFTEWRRSDECRELRLLSVPACCPSHCCFPPSHWSAQNAGQARLASDWSAQSCQLLIGPVAPHPTDWKCKNAQKSNRAASGGWDRARPTRCRRDHRNWFWGGHARWEGGAWWWWRQRGGLSWSGRDRERKAMRAGEKMHIVMFPNDGKEVRISRLA